MARERRLSEETVRRIVGEHSYGRQLGFLGAPRVSVLELNLALDKVTVSAAPVTGPLKSPSTSETPDIMHWLEYAAFLGIVILLAKPLGLYLARVFQGQTHSTGNPVLRPVESRLYRVLGVDPQREMTALTYFLCFLAFSASGTGLAPCFCSCFASAGFRAARMPGT